MPAARRAPATPGRCCLASSARCARKSSFSAARSHSSAPKRCSQCDGSRPGMVVLKSYTMARAELTLFAHIASRPDDEIDLAQAALLIAEDEYPGLDVAAYVERLDAIGDAARARLSDLDKPGDRRAFHGARLERVLAFVYRDLGFAGNATDYYDPRNSWLN